MRGEEFHIILPSNSSMRYFPENKTTCFTTELPQRIDLSGRWEVALTEIQFPCSFLHIRPGEGTIKFIDINKSIDAFSREDVEVSPGVYSSVRDIIETMNDACKPVKAHVVWELKAGGKVVMRLSCKERKCDMEHHVHFSDKLCRMLGFDSRCVSSNDLLPIYYNPDIPPSSGIAFPKFPFVLTGDDYIIADIPASLLRGIPDKLFVYCDICEPYITGDVQSPLLRIVAHDARNDYPFASTQIKHFSPAQYIALRRTSFRTIEIDIRDQLGKSIPFEFGTLTVTLHFRCID